MPFRSKDLTSLAYQIVHEDPLRASLRGAWGVSTYEFLSQCLAKDPNERILSAEAFATQARALQAGVKETELAETVPLGRLGESLQSETASTQRADTRLWIRALALLILITGAAWGLWYGMQWREGRGGPSPVAERLFPQDEAGLPSAPPPRDETLASSAEAEPDAVEAEPGAAVGEEATLALTPTSLPAIDPAKATETPRAERATESSIAEADPESGAPSPKRLETTTPRRSPARAIPTSGRHWARWANPCYLPTRLRQFWLSTWCR